MAVHTAAVFNILECGRGQKVGAFWCEHNDEVGSICFDQVKTSTQAIVRAYHSTRIGKSNPNLSGHDLASRVEMCVGRHMRPERYSEDFWRDKVSTILAIHKGFLDCAQSNPAIILCQSQSKKTKFTELRPKI